MKMDDYRSAFERERQKNTELAERIAELENKNDDLSFRLDRIKKNPLWKASTPARKVWHFASRQKERLSNAGSVRGVADKIVYKKNERRAMKQFGTMSFPTGMEREHQQATMFARPVTISILTPLYNTPEQYLRDMIESVMAQTYGNWQLCLADGSDDKHTYVGRVANEYRQLESAKGSDGNSRIVYKKLDRNLGISGNTNACLALATGEFIGLLDHDDILHPAALFHYVKAINDRDADYIYCDETTFSGDTIDHMLTMHFKPDYAIDNLRANNYICHFSVFHRRLLTDEELFRTQFDGSQDHDMILRLTDRASNIVHIPKLLYYWRSHPGSTAKDINAKEYAIKAAKGAVSDHLRRHGYNNFRITSTRAFETIFKISYEIEGDPRITIVIPNRDHEKDLRRCIDSIFAKTTYANFDVLIVENGSTTREIRDYYREISEGPFGDRIWIEDFGKSEPFNYSAVVNHGVSKADGEYVVLLNNDIEIITVNWLEELLMYAQRKDVGAVGGKLYFPDKRIQHGGVIIGLGAHRTAGHAHYGMGRTNLGYMGRLCYAQDMSAVTGAMLMVSKKKFEAAGGLDKTFAISLNDVDLCLRLRTAGYNNVFTPFAEAYHYESLSRGLDDAGEKAKRYNSESELFRTRWKKLLDRGDPYYNPNFTLDKSDFSLMVSEE